jgi:thymidylate kinase
VIDYQKKLSSNVFALEGLPCAGKTTISSKLAQYALKQNCRIFILPEFSRSPLGKLLYQFVRSGTYKILPPNSQRFIFLADRCHTFSKMLKLLEDNRNVILDRSIFSTTAFQLTLDTGKVPTINSIKKFLSSIEVVGGMRHYLPSKVILLDIKPDLAYQRGLSKSAFSYKELEIIRATYLKMAKIFDFEIIAAEEEIDVITTKVIEYAKQIGWFNNM